MVSAQAGYGVLGISMLLLVLGAACGNEVDTGAGGAGGDGGDGGATTTVASGGTGGTGTGGTGGDGGAGGETMGASAACQACVAKVYSTNTMCAGHIQACDNDAPCNDWKNCKEDCFNANDTEACYTQCDTEFPHDDNLGNPLLKCTCDSCASDCVASCAAAP